MKTYLPSVGTLSKTITKWVLNTNQKNTCILGDCKRADTPACVRMIDAPSGAKFTNTSIASDGEPS